VNEMLEPNEPHVETWEESDGQRVAVVKIREGMELGGIWSALAMVERDLGEPNKFWPVSRPLRKLYLREISTVISGHRWDLVLETWPEED
jgi:hypothetical protein